MSTFNKYKFVSELFEEITAEIEKGNIESEDSIQEYINSALDNEVIYYHDCFQIAMELNATSFTGWELGDAIDISQLAYYALYEYVNSKLDTNELNRLLDEKQNEIED